MKIAVLTPAIAVAFCLISVPAWSNNDNSEKKSVVLLGKILQPADEKGIIVILPKGKTDAEKDAVKVSTNDKTEVVIDGKKGKPADLKEGNSVKVTIIEDIAVKIEKIKADLPRAGA